jgi:Acyl-CoA dehydrogenase, C-terminal domain
MTARNNVNATSVSTLPTAEELDLLRRSARSALGALDTGATDEQAPSWTSSWDTLAAQGLWSTIEQPEGSLTAAAVVSEEAGRALYPGPVCEALSCAYLLDRLDDSASLRDVADGSPAAVFITDAALAVQPQRETLLVITSADGDLVATTAGEVDWVAPPSLDVSRPIAQMRLNGAATNTLSSADPALPEVTRAVAALLYCADTLGCIDHVLERTGEYANQRTTFGTPIGKYQAVAHRLVDHAVTAQQIRLLLDDAVAALDTGADNLALRVATVETLCHGRSTEIISDCIQLTGAIGFTWEYGHHFYLRRVVQNAALGSGPGRAAQRLAREASW